MSEVKRKLKDLLNTTFGGQPSQGGNLDTLNRNAYSPKNDYSLDVSIDKYRNARSKLFIISDSRKPSFSSSPSPSNSKNRYRSESSSQNTFFRKNNSSGLNTSHIHSPILITKSNNIELLTPSTETPLYFSKFSSDKIKREIKEIAKLLSKDEIKKGFRNRPAVDVNQPHMEFTSRSYFALSPTSTRRSFFTTSNVFKNLTKKKHIINFDDYLGKYTFNHKENDFETFAKELLPQKKNISVFERFPLNWRKKGTFN